MYTHKINTCKIKGNISFMYITWLPITPTDPNDRFQRTLPIL